jgi:inhibitor of KinA sporulation pathway (predicted exonuclease)
MALYICVLDFEATCDEDMKASNMDHEIIEFPSVLLKYEDGCVQRISEIQMFCKPKNNPVLTKFCKDLTGITQEQVDQGISFPEAFHNHLSWLKANIPNFEKTWLDQRVCILTCGRWDLETMLPKEYKNWNLSKNDIHDVYRSFVNCKEEFKFFYKCENVYGMTFMLDYLKLNLEGKHHSGIADCRNIARVVEHMIKDGCDPHTFQMIVAQISKKYKKN